MMPSRRSPRLLVLSLTLAALGAAALARPAAAAEVRLLSSIALQSALEDLAADFARANGDTLKSEFSLTATLAQRLQAGDAADVFVGTRGAVDELVKAGLLQPGSEVDLARSGVGVAVRKGATKPDISTPAALKRALLAAKNISYTDPASGAVSGVHFSQVIETLGIAREVNAKTRHPPNGGFAARLLVSGEVDLAIQQNAELLSVPGVELVGPLPDTLQKITLFTAAVPSTTRQPEVGRALIRSLQTPKAIAVMKLKGLDPVAK